MPAWLAYTLAFAAGLVGTSLATSWLVFRVRFSVSRVLRFLVLYLAVFGVGQLVIKVISPTDPITLLTTSLIVLAVTTPLTFIGGHFIFRLPTAAPPTPEELSE